MTVPNHTYSTGISCNPIQFIQISSHIYAVLLYYCITVLLYHCITVMHMQLHEHVALTTPVISDPTGMPGLREQGRMVYKYMNEIVH